MTNKPTNVLQLLTKRCGPLPHLAKRRIVEAILRAYDGMDEGRLAAAVGSAHLVRDVHRRGPERDRVRRALLDDNDHIIARVAAAAYGGAGEVAPELALTRVASVETGASRYIQFGVKRLLAAGLRNEAIAAYRAEHGCTLIEAKEAVEALVGA